MLLLTLFDAGHCKDETDRMHNLRELVIPLRRENTAGTRSPSLKLLVRSSKKYHLMLAWNL